MGPQALLWSLFGLLGAAAQAPAAAPSGSVPYFSNKTRLTVCTTDRPPMVYCDGMAPTDFYGFEVDLFKGAAARVGWGDGQVDFRCLPYGEAVQGGLNGTCDILVGSLTSAATNSTSTSYFAFSSPTYRSSLRVLTLVEQGGYDMWSWLQAFTWQLWVAIVLTMVGVGLAAWFVELATQRVPPGVAPFQTTVWQAFCYPLFASWLEPGSNAGWVLYAAFALWSLIVNTLFLANTASIMTTNAVTSEVSGIQDLSGKRAGVWALGGYAGKLRKHGVIAVPIRWESSADDGTMLAALRDGEVEALVMAEAWVNRQAALNCDVVAVGNTFEPFSEAVAFAALDASNATLAERVGAFNEALASLEDNGAVAVLQYAYMNPTPQSCNQVSSTQVSLSQVAGLWIILAGCVAFSLLLVALHLWRNKWRAALARKPWAQRHLPRRWLQHAERRELYMEGAIEKASTKLAAMLAPDAGGDGLPAAHTANGAPGFDAGSDCGGSDGKPRLVAGDAASGVQAQLAAMAASMASLAAEQRRLGALLEATLGGGKLPP